MPGTLPRRGVSRFRGMARRPELLRDRRVLVALQLVVAVAVIGFLGYFLRDAWIEAWPLLTNADPVDISLGLAFIAAYYLVFVLGWLWILAATGVRISYWIALQAEMASMLAKYIPGGVWTPLARIVWLRRSGVEQDEPRARVDPARGRPLGARRRARVRPRPDLGGGRRPAAHPAPRLLARRRRPDPPEDLRAALRAASFAASAAPRRPSSPGRRCSASSRSTRAPG